jgi:hypothetical protein
MKTILFAAVPALPALAAKNKNAVPRGHPNGAPISFHKR